MRGRGRKERRGREQSKDRVRQREGRKKRGNRANERKENRGNGRQLGKEMVAIRWVNGSIGLATSKEMRGVSRAVRVGESKHINVES